MDLITKSIQLRENPEYSGPIWDLERLETMYEMEQHIAQLTAENERLQRVVEQATKDMSIDEHGGIWVATPQSLAWTNIGNSTTNPDLFAQLKGADRG